MILTSEQHAKHLCNGQNTQQVCNKIKAHLILAHPMEPGVEPDSLPVRPKTTNVRMGRQTPQEVSRDQVEAQPQHQPQPQPQTEVVQRPKTTQVRRKCKINYLEMTS